MARLDFKREYKQLYTATGRGPVELQVSSLRYLMVDGAGDPDNNPAFTAAVEALFKVSYTAKFNAKKGPSGLDWGVMPLEGLWWADDMQAFAAGDRSAWLWTLMILQPDPVPRHVLESALAEVRGKAAGDSWPDLRIDVLEEGRVAQILHQGPFTEEGPTVARLHAFIEARGQRIGRHHEIYLSDFRRTPPARWRTLLRQPFRT